MALQSAGLFSGSAAAVILGVAIFLGLVVASLAFLCISLSIWLTAGEHNRAALILLPDNQYERQVMPFPRNFM